MARVRRLSPMLVTALILFAVLTASCGSNQQGSSAQAMPRVPLPVPWTITSDGAVYTVGEVAPAGATLDSSNSRMMTVFIAQHSDPSDPACATLSPSARVVKQSSSAVYVASFAYQVPVTPTAARDCLIYQSAAEKPYLAQHLSLTQPLDGRPLIDVKTARPIGILDPSRLRKPS